MADIIPIAFGVSGFVNRRRDIVKVDTPAASPNSAPIRNLPMSLFQQLTFYFADADNTELFIPPPGTLACAWQANAITDTTCATVGSTGIIFNGGSNDQGWLHCLVRGVPSTGTTTTEAPVSKGTAGYVEPGRGIFLNHRNATPNTLNNAKRSSKLGMKLRSFPFAVPNVSDRWKSQSSGLCQGIVAVAWQANAAAAADQVAVTLDAAGDVIFTSAGGADPGWLWAWSR